MGISTRIIADFVIFFLIFIAPWWLTLFLVCVGVFFFEHFFESILFALLMDGFHGQEGMTFFKINALFTIIVSVVFIVSIFLKTRLKFYTD